MTLSLSNVLFSNVLLSSVLPNVLLSSILQLHAAWAWVVIIGNGLAGLWVLAAWRIPSMRTRALWWFVIFAEVAVIIQILLGILLVSVDKLRAPFFHYFYGVVSVVALSLLFGYRKRLPRKIYLLYGFGGLFLMGLGIRAMIVVLIG